MAQIVTNTMSSIYEKEPGVLSDYLDFLYDSGALSKGTAYNYYMILRSLAKFLNHQRGRLECALEEVKLSSVSAEDMASITEDEWFSYLDYYELTIREAQGSLAVRISAVKNFYRWLTKKYSLADMPFISNTGGKFPPRKKYVHVTNGMEERICAALEGENRERNLCIVRMFLHCGMSIQEICDLDLEDIELAAVNIRAPRTNRITRELKGMPARSVPLDSATVSAVDEYLAVRNPPKDGTNAFFVSSQHKGRLRKTSIEKMLRKAVRDAGLGVENVTIRDMQLTAKRKLASEMGSEEAAALTSAKTQRHFKKIYGGLAAQQI